MRKIVKSLVTYLWGLMLTLALWHVLAWLIASPALPLPYESFHALIRYWDELSVQLWSSFYRVVISICLGVFIGYPLALLTARTRYIDQIISPFLYLVYPLPKVMLLPVLFVLLGIADAPKIALISLTIVFQVTVAQRDALKNIDESIILSAKSMGANYFQQLVYVYIPASLPSLFTALRIVSGTAIAVLFIAESIAGTSGLGYYIVNAWGLVNYAQMFAGIICMAALGLVLYECIHLVEFMVSRDRFS